MNTSSSRLWTFNTIVKIHFHMEDLFYANESRGQGRDARIEWVVWLIEVGGLRIKRIKSRKERDFAKHGQRIVVAKRAEKRRGKEEIVTKEGA